MRTSQTNLFNEIGQIEPTVAQFLLWNLLEFISLVIQKPFMNGKETENRLHVSEFWSKYEGWVPWYSPFDQNMFKVQLQ